MANIWKGGAPEAQRGTVSAETAPRSLTQAASSIYRNKSEDPDPQAARPRMQLLAWTGIGKGALVGRAKVRLPSGLEIADIAIFAKDGRSWVQLPAQVVRDADGRPLTDERGKVRYVSPIKWSTWELQEAFSNALVTLVRIQHPDAIPGAAP